MIQINKQLERPDGGVVPSGSLLNYSTKFGQDLTANFYLTHWLDQDSKDAGKLPIASILDFKYALSKQCTAEEWVLLNEAGSALLVENWLKSLIDSEIGAGYTVIL